MVAILLLLSVGGAAVFFFSASNWLESATGMKLLQRELGKGLGLEAHLQGEYALGLFPALRIEGQQLLLQDVPTSLPVAQLDSYTLHIALWPLLVKQIVIHKIVVEGGFLDLGLLQGNGASEPGESTPGEQLPSIRSLQVRGLDLLQSGTGLLKIDELLLENFSPNVEAAITLRFSLPHDQAESSFVQLKGTTKLATGPLQLSVSLADLSIRFKDRAWSLGQGRVSWSIDSGALQGELTGQISAYSSQFRIEVQTIPDTVIVLATTLETGDGQNLSGEVSAHQQAGLWLLDPVEMLLVGQVLSGNGCFSLEAKPRLQLQLHAQALELDVLQDFLPSGLATAGADPAATDVDLPFDLAIEVVAERASMGGAVASEVRLVLGEQPNCRL